MPSPPRGQRSLVYPQQHFRPGVVHRPRRPRFPAFRPGWTGVPGRGRPRYPECYDRNHGELGIGVAKRGRDPRLTQQRSRQRRPSHLKRPFRARDLSDGNPVRRRCLDPQSHILMDSGAGPGLVKPSAWKASTCISGVEFRSRFSIRRAGSPRWPVGRFEPPGSWPARDRRAALGERAKET